MKKSTELILTGQQAMVRAEIDTQIATARNYPRDVSEAIEMSIQIATMSPEVAALCRYKKPVGGGKFAKGPSVRLAEIMASRWGNLRVQTQLVDVEDERVVVRGICHDLETNVAYSSDVTRSIMTSDKDWQGNYKEPERYSAGMIEVTIAGASSIARRNAIFQAIPRALIVEVEEAAKEAASIKKKAPTNGSKATGPSDQAKAQIAKLIASLERLGVEEDRVLMNLNIKHRYHMTPEQYDHLLTLGVAIKDGDTTIDDAFPLAEAKNIVPPAAPDDEAALADVDAIMDEIGA